MTLVTTKFSTNRLSRYFSTSFNTFINKIQASSPRLSIQIVKSK